MRPLSLLSKLLNDVPNVPGVYVEYDFANGDWWFLWPRQHTSGGIIVHRHQQGTDIISMDSNCSIQRHHRCCSGSHLPPLPVAHG